MNDTDNTTKGDFDEQNPHNVFEEGESVIYDDRGRTATIKSITQVDEFPDEIEDFALPTSLKYDFDQKHPHYLIEFEYDGDIHRSSIEYFHKQMKYDFDEHGSPRIQFKPTYSAETISFSVPATGESNLSVDEAESLADFIMEHKNDESMYHLMGNVDSPEGAEEVANALKNAISVKKVHSRYQ